LGKPSTKEQELYCAGIINNVLGLYEFGIAQLSWQNSVTIAMVLGKIRLCYSIVNLRESVGMPFSSPYPSEHSFFHRVPLQAILIVPFVLQIFAAVGLTGYLSLRNGQKAVRNLASRLYWEVTNRVEDRVESFLDQPQLVNRIIADATGFDIT
jgi:hypothetical protein